MISENSKLSVEVNYIFGYGRGSKAEQELTLQAQEQAIKRWLPGNIKQCERYAGFTGDEGVSSKISWDKRPGAHSIMGKIRAGDTIVASKLDRVSRSTRDGLRLIDRFKEMGIYLIVLDLPIDQRTPTGRLTFTNMLALAEFEREMISLRTKEALAVKRLKNLPSGSAAPVGWKKIGLKSKSRFVPDENARRWAVEIYRLRQQGLSLRKVAKLLHERNARTPRNRQWNYEIIRRYANAYYAGFPLPNGEVQNGPCVRPEIIIAAQSDRSERSAT